MTRYFVPAFLLLTLLCFNASAATLFGRVVEVNDGDVITVFNLNRPVRIKLLAVDAPERDQVFGDVAKKHLSELVYDKSVLVEYSGIAADGSLVGRVTLNNVDIGAQMIRDGVAWFDASNQDRLSASDREVYQQSEQAARNEKRGLWQGENPIAPWEFVKAKAQRRQTAASVNAVNAATKAPNQTYSELTNLTLMTARTNSGAPSPATAGSSLSGSSSSSSTPAWASSATPPSESWARPADPDMAWATDTSPKQWRPFNPAGENFSAEMPAGGKHQKLPVPLNDGSGKTVDLNIYLVRDGYAIYATMWITAPSYGESDRTAVDEAVGGFLKGMTLGYQRGGGGQFACELEAKENSRSRATPAMNTIYLPAPFPANCASLQKSSAASARCTSARPSTGARIQTSPVS